MLPLRPLFVVLFALLAGCLAPHPAPSDTASMGQAAAGYLLHGVSLPDRGPGYVRARPGEETRYGTPSLVGAITRAAAAVYEAFPGGAPLRVGDLSAPLGGHHARHHSHRSGRDVDLVFFATDASGRSTRGRSWLSFDHLGVSLETRTPSGAPSGALYFFDEARNWHLVRSLLADPEVEVQWIFCSNGVKARLLRYAAVHEPDPEILFRASWILHQPSSGNPHADHFHVRLFCSPRERALGCQDTGPFWVWLGDQPFKVPGSVEAMSDEALLAALAAPMDVDSVAANFPP